MGLKKRKSWFEKEEANLGDFTPFLGYLCTSKKRRKKKEEKERRSKENEKFGSSL